MYGHSIKSVLLRYATGYRVYLYWSFTSKVCDMVNGYTFDSSVPRPPVPLLGEELLHPPVRVAHLAVALATQLLTARVLFLGHPGCRPNCASTAAKAKGKRELHHLQKSPM